MDFPYIVLAVLSALIIILQTVMIIKLKALKNTNGIDKKQLDETAGDIKREISANNANSLKMLGDIINNNQTERFSSFEKALAAKQESNLMQIQMLLKQNELRFKSFETSMDARLKDIRGIVDEKMQQTLESKISQSFKIVNDRLEQVYKGLGEMQSLASGVGDLKKVLSNVKARGILGEIQLEAILSEILSPEQYEKNVETKKGSGKYVEFAIRLPGDNENTVYLPIDSKFPSDTYINLQNAYEGGNPEEVKAAIASMVTRMRAFAKDIHDKYISVPETTDFAIMFLPFEGLYAEAVNHGLVEVLQRDYKINIAGPSTMAALLNSLQMGFKTIAIQKRSSEVWEILGAVKFEFDKFNEVLLSTQKRLEQVNKELDDLVGRRTRAIIRKLNDVEKLESDVFDE